jgi:autotransporter-associated beta strand protein
MCIKKSALNFLLGSGSFWLACGFVTLLSPVHAQTPAFPGAVGFGAVATGGRGGTVYHVRNLYDSGPGSFRDAVSQPNRIVVFDVGGFTLLPSTNRTVNAGIQIQNNTTIAGQTAPGDGFGVIARETGVGGATNIIVRYIRCRQGMLDGHSAGNGVGGYMANSVIFDHVSIGFGQWNNIDAVGAQNITFQNCIIADPTGQQFNAHTEVGPFCWYRNLWANTHNRQPLARSDTVYVNNFVYDYQAAYTTTTSANYHHDLINNYFVTGPYTGQPADDFFQVNTNQLFYVAGNYRDSSKDGKLNGSSTTPGTAVTYLASPWSSVTTNLATVSAAAAVPYVVSSAGCSLVRDGVDLQTVSEALSLGLLGHGWTNQTQTGLPNFGYGFLNGGLPPVDSDQDGMPDYWESANGLNPNDPSDAANTNALGYMKLEEYLNWLADPHAIVTRWATTTNSMSVDLWPYTIGFTNLGATYTVNNPSNGVVSLLVDGHTAKFSPTSNYVGLASFRFTVTSSNSIAMTNTISVLVTAAAPATNLLWVGDGAANKWDVATTTNWTDGSSSAVFQNGCGVIFDDSGSPSPAVNISGALSPVLVSFTATNNFTLTNSAGSLLTGPMLLSKDGSGTLTLAGSNNFSGGVDLFAGTLILNNPSAAGTGSINLLGMTNTLTLGATVGNAINVASATLANLGGNTLNGAIAGGGTLSAFTTGTATLNGAMTNFSGTLSLANSSGTLRFNGGNSGSANATFDLGGNTAKLQTVNGNQTVQLGALTGGAKTVLSGATSAANLTTYVIGGNAANDTTTFPGTISDATGKTAIVKTGGGTLTLSGTNTYTGATSVSNGTLLVSGKLGASALTVSSGATLAGGGGVGGNVTNLAGSTIAPAGKFTLGGLVASNATLYFDLAATNSPGANGNDEIVLNGGPLVLQGTNVIQPNFVDGDLGPGTYTLVTGASSIVGVVSNLYFPYPTATRRSVSLVVTNGSILLTLVGSLGNLTWLGTNGSAWDLQTTTNWSNAGVPDEFDTLDTVNFTDSSTNGTVNLIGSLQPFSVVVSNSTRAYSFTGSGSIDGNASLVKNGSGTLTLTQSNSFSGGTFVNAGLLALSNNVANAYALGAGATTLNGGILQTYGYGLSTAPDYGTFVAPLVVNTAGTLKVAPRINLTGALTGSGTLTIYDSYVRANFNGDWSAFTGQILVRPPSGSVEFRLGNAKFLPAASLYLSNGVTAYSTLGNATIQIGELAGDAGATLGPGNGNGSNPTWVVGSKNTSSTFAGQIKNAGVTSLVKTGTGIFTLTASNSFSGGVVVNGGTLLVNNTTGSGTGSGAVDVQASATLGGSGSIAGSVSIEDDAFFAPGTTSIGTLTISNLLDLSPNSTTVIQVNKSAVTNDVVNVTSVNYDGQLLVTNLAGTLVPGDSFQIFNAGSYTGDFAAILGSPGPRLAWDFDPASGILSVIQLLPTNGVQFQATLTFTNYNRAEVLTNFPVLIVLNKSISGFDYQQFSAGSADLRFKSGDGATNLNYEMDTWNPRGDSMVWVQVPRFTNNCSIIASWGNLANTNPPACTTNGATWTTNFLAVWHLNQTPPDDMLDSTTNNNDAVSTNILVASQVDGLIGDSLDFDGADNWLNVSNTTPLKLTGGRFTLSAWVNLYAANTGVIMAKGRNGGSWDSWFLGAGSNYGADFNANPTNRLCVGFRYGSGPGNLVLASQTSNVTLSNWVSVVGTLDGANLTLYVNGQPNAVTPATQSPYNISEQVWIGADLNRNYLNGQLDELRVETVARSSNWIWAAYQNVASNAAFASYGAVNTVVLPAFNSVQFTNGKPNFTITGTPNFTYTMQGSTNLLAWTNLLVTNPPAMPFSWTDTSATNFNRRFYRVLFSP